MPRSPFHNAALYYISRGIPVFPLGAGSKVPLISAKERGHGLHDATTDRNQVNAWWTDHPAANVGLRTGIAFDVVDLDGPEARTAIRELRGDRPLVAPTVRTPHGHHLYFATTGLGNRAGVLPKVDVRGMGGYVVAPPSKVADAAYRWSKPLRFPLPAMPDWLAEVVRPKVVEVRPLQLSPERSTAYGRAALNHAVERLSQSVEGTRNHALNAESFGLGRLVAAGALEEDAASVALFNAGTALGLSERECERTIASGLQAGMARPAIIEAHSGAER